MRFNKSDLNYLKYDYIDKAVGGDDPEKKKKDAVFLNKKQSYEMAEFISDVMEEADTKDKEIGSEIEDGIHEIKDPFNRDELMLSMVRLAKLIINLRIANNG